MSEDLGNEGIAVVDKVVLHLRGVEHDELLVLLAELQSDVVDNFLQVFDSLLVFRNRIIVRGIYRHLKETIDTSISPQTLQMTYLGRELPQLAVFVHLLLDVVDNSRDLGGNSLDVFALRALVVVLVVSIVLLLEGPSFVPSLRFLLLCHVLVVDVSVAIASELATAATATSFSLVLLDPHVVDDDLPVFSEDAFDSGDAFCDLDDISHELSDLLLEYSVARLVHCLPIILGRVQDGEDLEDRNDFLMITLDVVLEVKQSVLHRADQGLLEFPVQTVHCVEPLVLDLLATLQEQFKVGVHEELANDLKAIGERRCLILHLLALEVHEASELVENLLDVSDFSLGDFLEFVFDEAILLLVHLDLLEDSMALFAAKKDEAVCIDAPGEFIDARLDLLVENGQVLVKQFLLVLVNEQHDVIVVADNEHHAFTKLSEPVALLVLTGQRRGDLQGVKCLYFVPVLDFDQVLQELSVEIA